MNKLTRTFGCLRNSTTVYCEKIVHAIIKYYVEILFILFFPILILFLYGFSPFNNYGRPVDSWFYFGYVHNFRDLIDRYGLPYYAVRFGLIVPLKISINIFGPVFGYLLLVYSMCLVAGVSIYLFFRKYYSVHTAVMAYVILTSSIWLARTILWTYTNAVAVIYLISAFVLIFIQSKYRRINNLIAGVLIGLAVNSNFFALSIGGLIVIAYLIYFKNNLWATMCKDIPWLIMGFLSVFLFGGIFYYYCCNTFNYLLSTLEIINWANSGGGEINQLPIKELLSHYYIYLVPFVIVISVITLRYRNIPHPRLLFASTMYLMGVAIYYIWYQYFLGASLLEKYFYFSYLLIPAIFCIILIPSVIAERSRSKSLILNISIASFLLPPLLFSFDHIKQIIVSPYLFWTGITVTILMFLITLKEKKIIPVAILLYGLVFHTFWFVPNNDENDPLLEGKQIYLDMYGRLNSDWLSRYRLGLKFLEAMPKYKDEKKPIYFWYANNDPLSHSLQSTYLWGYSRIMGLNEDKPGLPSIEGANVELLNKRSNLVLFHKDGNVVKKGLEVLRDTGIIFEIKRTSQICEKDKCYTITILDVEASNLHWSDEKYNPVNIALDWDILTSDYGINQDDDIISISTHPKAWEYAAVGSIAFSNMSVHKKGIVLIVLSVQDTSIGVGLTGDNHSEFIKRSQVMPKDERQELFFEIDNLDILEKIVISSWDKAESANIKIFEVSAKVIE